ncbi:hypothetical protein [Chroococcidiopsis sp. SAG 2025]|nr:hypothetical protein [Chroococcidiopsis sp. SAG 2025]
MLASCFYNLCDRPICLSFTTPEDTPEEVLRTEIFHSDRLWMANL